MSRRVRFTKMQGLGNDFVVFDGVREHVALGPDEIRRIADRHFGVGCDQILLVEKPARPDVDFGYRIFNADGGEVEQCGNGARCFVHFVRSQGLTSKRTIRVETRGGVIEPSLETDGQVTVDMGPPRFAAPEIPFFSSSDALVQMLDVNGTAVAITALSMGNPHAVQVVADVDAAPVRSEGPLIERHERFPQGVNAGYMQVIDRANIRLRVWERGAGETLAWNRRMRGCRDRNSSRIARVARQGRDARRLARYRVGRARCAGHDDGPGGDGIRRGVGAARPMSTNDKDESMDAKAVAEYLQHNSGFFDEYADVLAEIYVPHPHGGHAIPIAERQIVTLREKNGQIEAKLRELIQFGAENDAISEKLHRSTLALFSATDLETTLGVLYHSLKDDFLVPQVALRLWGKVRSNPIYPNSRRRARNYVTMQQHSARPTAARRHLSNHATGSKARQRWRHSHFCRCARTKPSDCSQ